MAKDAVQKTMGDTVFKVWWWSLIVYIVSYILVIIIAAATGISIIEHTNSIAIFSSNIVGGTFIFIAMLVKFIARIVLLVASLLIISRAFKLTKYYRSERSNSPKISSSRRSV
jgi:hypothetical protein